MKIGFKRVKDLLTGFAGLAGIGSLIELTKLKQRLSQTHLKENPRPEISHGDVVTGYLGLLCQGKPDFDNIEDFRDDEWFLFSLGLKKVPSSPNVIKLSFLRPKRYSHRKECVLSCDLFLLVFVFLGTQIGQRSLCQ